jgi:hypothetical protein
MPRAMAYVISRGMATLIELQTVYGSEDFYNLLEIAAVDVHNRNILNDAE